MKRINPLGGFESPVPQKGKRISPLSPCSGITLQLPRLCRDFHGRWLTTPPNPHQLRAETCTGPHIPPPPTGTALVPCPGSLPWFLAPVPIPKWPLLMTLFCSHHYLAAHCPPNNLICLITAPNRQPEKSMTLWLSW